MHSSISRKISMEALRESYDKRIENGVVFKDSLDRIYIENKKFMFFDIVGCDILLM
jgi:hypothetical protein